MKILVTNKLDRILEFFIVNPTGEIHLRELSRKLKISFPWVRKLILGLVKRKLLLIKKERHLVLAQANRENPLFIALKRSYNLFALHQSGLIESITDAYGRPEAIILFGSYSRGEDTEQSDIDIAVFTAKHLDLQLSPFEKKLGRKIRVQELQKDSVNKEFLTTLANGIVVEGYFDL